MGGPFSPDEMAEIVRRIRREGGLPDNPFRIDEVRYEPQGDKLFIIAHDRTDKSIIIGNSYVIGKLREELGVRQLTVYSTLDLMIKRRKLEEAEGLVRGTPLEFLLPIIEAEKDFPPRRWPPVRGDADVLVFLSFNARALMGFAERLGLRTRVVGIEHTFPRMEYEVIDAPIRWLFFPEEEGLAGLASEEGFRLVLADFGRPLVSAGGVFLLNPFRLLHIGFFELKYLFGFERPAVFEPHDLIEFITSLTYDGLMESADGARILWRMLRRRWKGRRGR